MFSMFPVPSACFFVRSPRTGFKLTRCCECCTLQRMSLIMTHPALALIHFRDGKLVIGKMVHRPCDASLSIFVPVDSNIRSAIVIPAPDKLHNHPRFPPEKLTHNAKRQYIDIIKAHGKPGASLAAIDHCKTLNSSWRYRSETPIVATAALTAKLHPALTQTTPQDKK